MVIVGWQFGAKILFVESFAPKMQNEDNILYSNSQSCIPILCIAPPNFTNSFRK
jgi:hypothetical protein